MNEATSELLAEANDIVREQLALAWREHIERVTDMLAAQWPERMERVIEETIAGLEARHRQAVRSGEIARRDLVRNLNQVARRLRGFEDERQWSNTLVDATRGFCGRAALFLLREGKLRLETTRNFDDADLADQVPLNAAPAFASAVDGRDTLVAMRSRSELSEPIAAYAESEDDGNTKCYLFPVVARLDVMAVLYVDSDVVDVDAIELLVTMAGAVYESRPPSPLPATAVAPTNGLVTISAAPLDTSPRQPETVPWVSLSREDRELHLRAQRFARVQVAEIRLYQSDKVINGRTADDLYTSLKKEIDSAREAFRREFLNASGSMVDYLHLELVRTLANDDVDLLGKNYPGPMV